MLRDDDTSNQIFFIVNLGIIVADKISMDWHVFLQSQQPLWISTH